MSINRPSWPHSTVELLEQISNELAMRLNSDPQPAGLWRVEFVTGQFALSRPGALRVIFSIVGGRIMRGAQYHGNEQPAKCVASRVCTIRAEIRTIDARSQGFTKTDLMLADEVLRALILVWDHQRPADYDEEEQRELWDGFTEEPGQRQIICRYEVTPLLLVHDDPWQFKTINSIESSGSISP